jgi:hypothetical protein
MNDCLAPVLSLKTKVNGAKHKVEENGSRGKKKGDRPLIFDVTSNKSNKFAAAELLKMPGQKRCFLRSENSRGQRIIHSA